MKRILFLADSYLPNNHRYGPHLESIITYLQSLHCNLLVVRTNSFLNSTFCPAISYFDNYKNMLAKIKTFNPDLIFSVNRNGLTREVLEECTRSSVPIINWIVDAVDQIDPAMRNLSNRDSVTLFTSGIGEGINSKENFLRELGISEKQLSLFPFFVDSFHFYSKDQIRNTDVSFVASGYEQSLLTEFIRKFVASAYVANIENVDQYVKKNLDILVEIYKKHQRTYLNNLYEQMQNNGFDFTLLKEHEVDLWKTIQQHKFFQILFDAHITSQNRVKSLNALADLKLDLYGVPASTWISQLCAANIELIRSFNFRAVATYLELSDIYNRSKLSLNVQSFSSCGTGFSFRVFDIIACKSLLLTESSTVPTFEHLGFKDQIDFISFDSPEDLKAKAHYLVNNENQRLEIVEAAYKRLESFLDVCSLKAVLYKNLKDVKFDDLAQELQELTRDRFLQEEKNLQPKNVKNFGW